MFRQLDRRSGPIYVLAGDAADLAADPRATPAVSLMIHKDWTSRCESSACVETRTVDDLVEVRDTEHPEQVLTVPARAWAEYEAALRAEGRQQAVKALRDLPHSLPEHRHLWELVRRLEVALTEVRDEAKGTSDDE